MNTVLVLALIGSLQVTSYRSVKNQTDSSPFFTSIGERVSPDGVAVSQDLLCGACLKEHRRCQHPENAGIHYQDWLYIQDVGLKRVNDVMNIRHKQRCDVWVQEYKDEKQFHKTFKNRKLVVYVIKEMRHDEETH